MRLLKPITSAPQTLLDEVQAHIKTQGLDAISGLKGDTVRVDCYAYPKFYNYKMYNIHFSSFCNILCF